ncbi:alanine racemase [Winogradskyella maritima]|uniref:Alanine racemase n=1 Tax=Winogradskyella maritima TaxID=1517766 RepID=A0ABV8AFS3_9FLAO|nr:alanine racemase [Winogradskyella maritima]
MPKAKETVLEIDLKALEHNYHFLKSKLKPNTKFLAVVKAFAYGSDSATVAKKLQDLDVDYFAVAYVNEGVVLRDSGITKPILVLHPQPVNFKTLIERCLEPSLYNAKILKEFIAVADAENQTNYPVHIKFNTGLNRLGFWESDTDYISEHLKATKAVKAISVFSHLAASEDLTEIDFTKTQIKNFTAIADDLSSKLGHTLWRHLCNTSGVLNYPEAHFDMVRCGIGLYGFGNAPEYNTELKPIATLKSVISQIHKIEPEESVGYNRAYTSNGYEKTATIPIGHADGISRQFGLEKGAVFIQGKSAPIIGNVCMDMIMVNVTGIDCTEGDEVIVFNANHTASEFASTANTISYEILTAISQRVKRTFLH